MKVYLYHLLTLSALLGAGVALAAEAPPAAAESHDWPQWRGPHFDGSNEAASLPESFSKTENVLWTAKLPGPGNSTPIVSGGRIFVSAIQPESKKLFALCLDLTDGRVLWQKEIGVGFKDNGRNNMTSPSPMTDGKNVFFFFGTGDLNAFDFDGKPLWSRNVQKEQGEFRLQHLYGSSALLYEGRIYVECLQRDTSYENPSAPPADSYLLAIDAQTGKDLWKQIRPNDAAGESKEAYTTPIPVETSAGRQIVLVGGDCVTGHDAATGKELWRFGGWNPAKINHWRMVPSAVRGEGLIFACAPKGGPVMAINESGSGDLTSSGSAWQSKEMSSDVCVPLIYRHQLYVLNGDKKTLYCVEPKTGKIRWEGKLGGSAVFRASATAADGKIFCVNEAGDLWVISAEEFKVLNHLSLGGRPVRSSVALTDGHVIVRAGDDLYAFGKK